jgi:hypothetical protein
MGFPEGWKKLPIAGAIGRWGFKFGGLSFVTICSGGGLMNMRNLVSINTIGSLIWASTPYMKAVCNRRGFATQSSSGIPKKALTIMDY